MPDLPTGTVTFLLTDVEGSVRLWEQYPAEMRQALVRHDELVEQHVQSHCGIVVRPRGEGDSRLAVFARATDAVAAACALQIALHVEPWPTPAPLRVRVVLHTGEADLRDGDYYGSAINRCARIRAIAHGGQVLMSHATYDLVRDSLPPDVSLRDLGEQRLRDLTRAEPVLQLVHPDLPADFPPLRSLDAYPNNLPLQVTSFVGREREIAEVRRLLASTRLLTITGTGGCGKTRLALQVAADLLDEYPDGVWVVDLAPIADPSLVSQTTAQALGLHQEGSQPIQTLLVSYLKSRHLLLLLDNCEHLIDACASLADLLIHSCPRLRILATSRESLGISGEVSWRVPSLASPQPDGSMPLAQLTQYEAVRLFVDRALAVQPSFVVTNHNAPAVAQVCWRLDGIPLAIELAAARVRALPVEQIASHLDDRFRLLTGGSRTALRRQQTLRATVDWSYDLLSPVERMMLRRLAVFAGGCTLEAAETVCSGEGIEDVEVLDLILRLVDRSLVVAEEQSGEARYRLLETMRQYAQEKLLESGEAARLRTRHLSWCLALSERAEPELSREQQGIWLDRLAPEHDNLRGALDWALETNVEVGLRIVAALLYYWLSRGHYGEGRRRLADLLARAREPTELRARALQTAAWMAYDQCSLAEAELLAQEMLTVSRQLNNRELVSTALLILGSAARQGGDVRRSSALLEESLAAREEQALNLHWISHSVNTAYFAGDLTKTRALLRDANSLLGSAKSERDRGMLLANLSRLAMVEDRPALARADGEEALALFRRIHDRRHVASVLGGLAAMALDEGDLPKAAVLLAEALPLSEQIGNDNRTARNLVFLGCLALAEGDIELARGYVERSLRMVRQVGLGVYLPFALCGMVDVELSQGDVAQATSRTRECLAFCRDRGLGLGLLGALRSAAAVAAKKGALDRGVRLLGAVWDKYPRGIFVELPASRARAESFLTSARCALGEEAFACAWAEGEAMTLDEAVEYALGEDENPQPEASPAADAD